MRIESAEMVEKFLRWRGLCLLCHGDFLCCFFVGCAIYNLLSC